MNLQHVIKVNHRLHEIRQASNVSIVTGYGKQFTIIHLASKRVTVKHATTGQFKTAAYKL